METLDLSTFVEDNLDSEVLAYEHALDLAYLFVREMEKQNMTRKELAERMSIPQSRLSKLLNTQPNMTLETIASFELALDIRIDFQLDAMFSDTNDVRVRFTPEIKCGWKHGDAPLLQEVLKATSRRDGTKSRPIHSEKKWRLAA